MVLSARSVDRGSAIPMSSPPCICRISATRALHHLDVKNCEINCQKLDLLVPLNSALVSSAGRYPQSISGRIGPCILSLCQQLLPVWCFCFGRRGHKPRLRARFGPHELPSESTVKNEHNVVSSEQRMLKTGFPHVDVGRGEGVVLGVAQIGT